MRKFLSIFIIFAILINTAGCTDAWRKKFIRKKKDVAKKPRIWQDKKYTKEPTEALYSKHYNYAINWLSELSDDLGQNNKKDLRCAEEALSQIQDMQYCLIPDKANELDKHIDRIIEVRDILKRSDLSHANKDYVRSTVDREERFLRSEFYYRKIQKFMKKSFEEEEDLPETKEIEGV
ncbi:MAG: hypothetical protein Q8R38_03935 [Candidatus Omnitrophota bacterium]|nr:hypothetical protein [Candidatus Omnitrophota bacterium]